MKHRNGVKTHRVIRYVTGLYRVVYTKKEEKKEIFSDLSKYLNHTRPDPDKT